MAHSDTKSQPGMALFCLFFQLFHLGFVVCKHTEFAYLYNLTGVYRGICILCCLGLAAVMLRRRIYRRITLRVFLAVTVPLGITVLLVRDTALLVLLCLLLAAPGLDLRRIVRVDLAVRICLFAGIVSLSLAGIIDNYTAEINGSLKQALGFSHPNTFAIYGFCILMEWLYLRYDRLRRYDLVGITVLAAVLFRISASRTALCAFLPAMALVLVMKRCPRIIENRLFRRVCCLFPALLAAASLVGVFLYSRGVGLFVRLNSLLTGRLSLAWSMLSSYGFSLFGQRVTTTGTRTTEASGSFTAVDMSFIRIPVCYGLIALALLLLGYGLLTRRTLRCGDAALLTVLIFFFLLGFMESYFYRAAYNFTLIALLPAMGQSDDECSPSE